MDDPLTEPKASASSSKCQLHGVLVRVFDTGVLLIGDSGIGKSECALELIGRGHQLAADDVVEVTAEKDKIVGKAPQLTYRLLEIRGLGILNVAEVFGEDTCCDETAIDVCIELRRSVESNPLEDPTSEYEIAGAMLPRFVLAVDSGGNLATRVETAVRLHRIGHGSRTSELLIAAHDRSMHSVG